MRQLKITIRDLPVRVQTLTETDLTGVFGGCKYTGYCSDCADCCPFFHCLTLSTGARRCEPITHSSPPQDPD